MRLIVFGDIHGCIEEWQELLRRVDAQPSDRLVAVGDLVAKGPSTKRVLDLAMTLPDFQSVLGNHEWALLRYWEQGQTKSGVDDDHRAMLDELGADMEKYVKFIQSWPLYLEFPECLVVHAGIRPGIPLQLQKKKDLLTIRTLETTGRPWYENYEDPQLIVHGHWAAQGLNVRPNVIGLDSGCVYGKQLSAVILPERRVVSVPAKAVYKPITPVAF